MVPAMNPAVAIPVCMAALAASVPLAVMVWGAWSVPTGLLVLAVACIEVLLTGWLLLHVREQQRLIRFGYPLRYEHMPTHYGPLPARRGG
jgi:hypothetical protein